MCLLASYVFSFLTNGVCITLSCGLKFVETYCEVIQIAEDLEGATDATGQTDLQRGGLQYSLHHLR